LRAENPDIKITIEIHEAAVTDRASMLHFRKILQEIGMKLSYDDFGAGQGRLLELGEVPPDVLKFDMQLIRGIDTASAKRQELLATLVRMARDLGATPLTEGVETANEHQTCQQLGFELGQGFYYGRPAVF
jgi:EAL domain-containing protein (putative c-di-GMP-specific phosphodiesterase class I)